MDERLVLDKITVVCIDHHIERGINALMKCIEQIKFGAAKIISQEDTFFNHSELTVCKCEPINSKEAYSSFVTKELYKYINTEFCLIVQWDGFCYNSGAWTDEFYDYDYIGARWFWQDNLVGNGGFSLRSKKILEFMATDPKIIHCHPEDNCFCKDNRKYLEESGFKFAPSDIAYRFSVEGEEYTGQFGWHGGIRPMTKPLI
jgi:hypothetical protein